MTPWRYPLFSSCIIKEDVDAAAVALSSGWLTAGPRVSAFEEAFASAIGLSDAVLVSSGTAALHLALLAAGVGTNDEVILPSLTFVSAAAMVRLVGAIPVFADIKSPVEPYLDVLSAEKLVTSSTRAVIVMHYGGQGRNLAAYAAFAQRYNLVLIEDAAHMGWPGQWCPELGQLSDFTCFSFYSTKPLGLGEGGLVTGRKGSLLSSLRRLRSHDLTVTGLERHNKVTVDYDVQRIGFNYRPTEITAAIGLSKCRRAENDRLHRLALARRYGECLAEVSGISLPLSDGAQNSAHHLMPLLLGAAIDRERFVTSLHGKGVQTGRHYVPIHFLTAYRNECFARIPLKQTELASARLVSVPLHSDLSIEDIDAICSLIKVAAAWSIKK